MMLPAPDPPVLGGGSGARTRGERS
jgi:hypothetical protein